MKETSFIDEFFLSVQVIYLRIIFKNILPMNIFSVQAETIFVQRFHYVIEFMVETLKSFRSYFTRYVLFCQTMTKVSNWKKKCKNKFLCSFNHFESNGTKQLSDVTQAY